MRTMARTQAATRRREESRAHGTRNTDEITLGSVCAQAAGGRKEEVIRAPSRARAPQHARNDNVSGRQLCVPFFVVWRFLQ